MVKYPQSLFRIQPVYKGNEEFPENLSLTKCKTMTELTMDYDIQPSFDSLPPQFQTMKDGWYPPVFHYGYTYDSKSLVDLCDAHKETHPRWTPSTGGILTHLRRLITPGHMDLDPVTSVSRERGHKTLLSVATNCHPWVDTEMLQHIDGLLKDHLGEARWFLDPLCPHWATTPWYDEDDRPMIPHAKPRRNPYGALF